MQARQIVPVFKDTWGNFQRHNAQWLAAALAYFAAFAVAPLIIVVVEIAGAFLGSHQRVLSQIYSYMQRDAGGGAAAIKQIVATTFAHRHQSGIAQYVGWGVFLLAAIGLFSAVQFALNTAWDLKPRYNGIWHLLWQRVCAFGVLMAIALLLLLSIVVNAALTLAGTALAGIAPFFPVLIKAVDFAVSFGVVMVALAVLFEYLPECRIEWRDVWTGAAMTSLLFVIGQFLLGWYLGRAGVSSGYGAFGSLVVFLIWSNYTAQIMLFGAEFTRVYAERFGSKARKGATRGEVNVARVPVPE